MVVSESDRQAVNPILLDVPESFETERLLLRMPRPGDGAQLYEAMRETEAEIRKWFGPWAREPITEEKAEQIAREGQVEFLKRSELLYVSCLKESNILVGRVFLTRIDWTVPKMMIGYWTRTTMQRRGFGLEALVAAVDIVINVLKAKRLEAYIDPRNGPSRSLFERAGFKLEGELRNYGYDNYDEMRNYLVYSVIWQDISHRQSSNELR